MKDNLEGNKRKPDWLKTKVPLGKHYASIKEIVNKNNLHTICTSGNCPNIAECWGNGTATFMILGDICTRSCKFCAVKTGRPEPVDWNEPKRLAQSVKLMGVKHCVLTSVDRDDLEDGGAGLWAEAIREVKRENPHTTIEALIPDFQGEWNDLKLVIDAKPEVISHNLETVKRLTPKIRSKAKYERSLELIKIVSKSGLKSKSGIMVGVGETEAEVCETMDDLINVNCQIFTIGQYLQPTKEHLPVDRYVTPQEFDKYREIGLQKGFMFVESKPLVRSSFHAEKHLKNC